ncbi:MAG: aminotransferase class I/II-fold pyridoxal phosphate-dependent enzyme [Thermoproteota archaeon]|nr:aminotransferase class I/II-fold pyridoxal phosphate-dependent enzyme [Thermoproteota archaeon]
MVKKTNQEELSELRAQIRDLTLDIIAKAHKRMELSERIGIIKGNLNLDIQDESVEQEIRKSVIEISYKLGIDPAFSGRLLNILLMESVRLQQIHQKRTENVTLRNTHLSIFMKAKELENSGKRIIHMEVGEPDFSPPKQVQNALLKSYKMKQYHYTDSRGLIALRQAIAKKVGNGITDQEVIITSGGRFAIFSAVLALLKQGEEAIVIDPSWPAYREFVDLAGGKIKILHTTLNERWTPSLRKLEEMIGHQSKLLILNYPNNPTGRVLGENEISKIISLARDNALYVISDEVYSDYSFTRFTSLTCFEYDKSIVVSSFSKSCAMTGFRVGYGIAKKAIIDKMARIQAIALTSVAEPMQRAALSAIDYDPAENVKVIRERLDLILENLRRMPVEFIRPEGAMYVYPRLKGSIQTDTELVNRLLELGVAVAPGSGFGENYNHFIRISACQPKQLIDRGLKVIDSVLSMH